MMATNQIQLAQATIQMRYSLGATKSFLAVFRKPCS